jgi:hypothetical protein
MADLRSKAHENHLSKCPQEWPIPLPVFEKSNLLMGYSEPNTVVIDGNIVTNQFWSADNIYLVDGDVDIQAMLVIEPGTEIQLTTDSLLRVNNGGTLISVGEPDNPILYTSQYDDPYQDEYCYIAICVDETALLSTRIEYNWIEYAVAGILTNNIRLDSIIQNNYLFKNIYGIYENGALHTDIINNLIMESEESSIEIYMESLDGVADSNTLVQIANNTCDGNHEKGIEIHGVDDAGNAGMAILGNNIITRASYYGIGFLDGHLNWSVYNTGYGNNFMNKNFDFAEFDPVEVEDNPYRSGPGPYDHLFLNQNCAFIDAGYEYIEETTLIGKTTDINSMPDCNKIDLGFHHPNWNYSNTGSTSLKADFDNDYTVDLNDLSDFASYWLYDYDENYRRWYWDFDDSAAIDFNDLKIIADYWLEYFDFYEYADFASFWQQQVDYRFQNTMYDLNEDDYVDWQDFAILASEWQKTKESPYLAINPSVSGDPCNLSGIVTIWVNGANDKTEDAFVLMDGRVLGRRFGFEDGYGFELETYAFDNGKHNIKIVTSDQNGIITVSQPKTVCFNNDLYCLNMGDDYEQNRDYSIHAMYSGSNNLMIDIIDIEGNVLWTDTFAENIDAIIPTSIFDSNALYEVIISETGILLENYDSWIKKVGKKFKPKQANPSTKALIICPDKKVTKRKYECIQKAIKAFEQKGINYVVLYKNNAHYSNMAFCLEELPVKYLYFIGHGNYEVAGKYRTAIELADGVVFSAKRSDFDPNNIPGWCEDIGKYDKKGKSLLAMNIPIGKIKIAYFDSCYSGRLKFTQGLDLIEGLPDKYGFSDPSPSDMCLALRMGYTDQIYKCWYDKCYAIDLFTYHVTWSNNFWYRLGLSDSVQEAIDYTINHTPGILLKHGPHKNYRLKAGTSGCEPHLIRLQN